MNLLERGWEAERVRKLYRLIDWLLELPVELQMKLRSEVREYEREKQMPYVVSDERIAREEGRQEGRQEGVLSSSRKYLTSILKKKFGRITPEFEKRIAKMTDVAVLESAILNAITATRLEEVLPE